MLMLILLLSLLRCIGVDIVILCMKSCLQQVEEYALLDFLLPLVEEAAVKHVGANSKNTAAAAAAADGRHTDKDRLKSAHTTSTVRNEPLASSRARGAAAAKAGMLQRRPRSPGNAG